MNVKIKIVILWSFNSVQIIFLFTDRKSADESELTEADQNLKRTIRARKTKKVK